MMQDLQTRDDIDIFEPIKPKPNTELFKIAKIIKDLEERLDLNPSENLAENIDRAIKSLALEELNKRQNFLRIRKNPELLNKSSYILEKDLPIKDTPLDIFDVATLFAKQQSVPVLGETPAVGLRVEKKFQEGGEVEKDRFNLLDALGNLNITRPDKIAQATAETLVGSKEIKELLDEGKEREAFARFEELPLQTQLALYATPVLGETLSAIGAVEYGKRAQETEGLARAGNIAMAGLEGLGTLPAVGTIAAAGALGARGLRRGLDTLASTSETIPGPSTGQLKGITELPEAQRAEYSLDIYRDPSTGEMYRQDPFYQALGVPQKDVRLGQGFYDESFNPLFISRPIVKTEAGIPRPQDVEKIKQRDDVFGFITQQEGTPTSRVVAGPKGRNDTIKLSLKTGLSQDEFKELAGFTKKYELDPVTLPKGVTFFNNKSFDNLEELSDDVVSDIVEFSNKKFGDKIEVVEKGNFDSINYSDFSSEFAKNADELADISGTATKRLFQNLDTDAIRKLDASKKVRKFVENKLEVDLTFARENNLPIRKDINTALTIIKEKGFAGLKKALDEGRTILPAVVFVYLGQGMLRDTTSPVYEIEKKQTQE